MLDSVYVADLNGWAYNVLSAEHSARQMAKVQRIQVSFDVESEMVPYSDTPTSVSYPVMTVQGVMKSGRSIFSVVDIGCTEIEDLPVGGV